MTIQFDGDKVTLGTAGTWERQADNIQAFNKDAPSGALRELRGNINNAHDQGQAPIWTLENLSSGEVFVRFRRKNTAGVLVPGDWILGIDTSRGASDLYSFMIFRDGQAPLPFVIDASGKVGFGLPNETTVPAAKVDVRGSANETQLSIRAHSSQTAPVIQVLDSAGTSKLVITQENSGAGIRFDAKSSADHAAPPDGTCVMFTRTVSSTKTQLVARFATGAVQVVATEP